MQKALTLADSTIGKKALLAVSGVVIFGFVIGHMLGNLQVFLGPEKLNAYAATLHNTPALLWGTRIVLLVSIVTHVSMAMQLVMLSRAARPVSYFKQQNVATNYAALTMKLSGPILLLYIVFHLAHFTFPGVALGSYEHSATNVYANVVQAFSVPWVAAVYILAQLLVGLHLYHGAWSLFQTLGLNHPRYEAKKLLVARSLAMLVVVGNVSMPVCVLIGVIPPLS